MYLIPSWGLFINTGEGLSGGRWACLPTHQGLSGQEGNSAVGDGENRSHFLFGGNHCSIFPLEAFREEWRRIWYWQWSPHLSV